VQPLAKFYRYPHPDGARKVKSRALREWRRAHNGDETAWPGAEIIDAPDQETARKLAKTRLKTPLTCDDPPPSHPVPTPLTCDDPVVTTSFIISSTLQTGKEKGPRYACLDLKRSLPLCQDSAFKLWTVLAAHARTYRQTRWKVTADIWLQAGIHAPASRTRALARLEELGMAKVERPPGQSPVVTLRLSRDGFPVPFEESKKT
jgi:hypothetical protein